MLRKVACAAASKPSVEIRQNGEQFYIKTSTTVRTTEINFQIGQEFNEETVDGRKCKVITEHWDNSYLPHMIILYKLLSIPKRWSLEFAYSGQVGEKNSKNKNPKPD